MDRLNHIIEVIRQSHHLPWVIAFFVGLVLVQSNKLEDAEILGDNVPASLMDGLNG